MFHSPLVSEGYISRPHYARKIFGTGVDAVNRLKSIVRPKRLLVSIDDCRCSNLFPNPLTLPSNQINLKKALESLSCGKEYEQGRMNLFEVTKLTVK